MAHRNRRDFIKQGLAAGGAFSSAPALVRSDEVNVGFISCGGRASQLTRNFEKPAGLNGERPLRLGRAASAQDAPAVS